MLIAMLAVSLTEQPLLLFMKIIFQKKWDFLVKLLLALFTLFMTVSLRNFHLKQFGMSTSWLCPDNLYICSSFCLLLRIWFLLFGTLIVCVSAAPVDYVQRRILFGKTLLLNSLKKPFSTIELCLHLSICIVNKFNAIDGNHMKVFWALHAIHISGFRALHGIHFNRFGALHGILLNGFGVWSLAWYTYESVWSLT